MDNIYVNKLTMKELITYTMIIAIAVAIEMYNRYKCKQNSQL